MAEFLVEHLGDIVNARERSSGCEWIPDIATNNHSIFFTTLTRNEHNSIRNVADLIDEQTTSEATRSQRPLGSVHFTVTLAASATTKVRNNWDAARREWRFLNSWWNRTESCPFVVILKKLGNA